MLKPYEDAVLTLPDRWLTGSHAYVIDEIAAMAPAQAAYATGCVIEEWTLRGQHRAVADLLKRLRHRAEEHA